MKLTEFTTIALLCGGAIQLTTALPLNTPNTISNTPALPGAIVKPHLHLTIPSQQGKIPPSQIGKYQPLGTKENPAELPARSLPNLPNLQARRNKNKNKNKNNNNQPEAQTPTPPTAPVTHVPEPAHVPEPVHAAEPVHGQEHAVVPAAAPQIGTKEAAMHLLNKAKEIHSAYKASQGQ